MKTYITVFSLNSEGNEFPCFLVLTILIFSTIKGGKVMGYLSDITLLGVIGVNIISIFLFCTLASKVPKHHTKKKMIIEICLLAAILIFDFVCMAGFIKNGVAENGTIFVLFFPLVGYFMYENIKELRETAR